jgi:hypothetical protein
MSLKFDYDIFEHVPALPKGARNTMALFRCRCCEGLEASAGYMVEDQYWAFAGLDPHCGSVCLRCLDKRMTARGLPLQRLHFHVCPLNQNLFYIFDVLAKRPNIRGQQSPA